MQRRGAGIWIRSVKREVRIRWEVDIEAEEVDLAVLRKVEEDEEDFRVEGMALGMDKEDMIRAVDMAIKDNMARDRDKEVEVAGGVDTLSSNKPCRIATSIGEDVIRKSGRR